MKVLTSQNLWTLVALFAVAVIVSIMPEFAMAQEGLAGITGDRTFQKFVTLGIGLLAVFKWFDYFNSWGTGNAFLGLITPGLLTFLYFQWQTVLGWFQLV